MQDGEIWVGDYVLHLTDGMKDKSSVNPNAGIKRSPWLSHSLVSRQTGKQMIAMQMRDFLSENRESSNPARGRPTKITVGSLASLAVAAAVPETIEQHDQRLYSRVSTFDVDRPCLILTPYDHEMERFPRPGLRGMNFSCIVELPSQPPDQTNKHGKRAAVHGERSPDCSFEVLRRVKGMGKIMKENLHLYELV
jgi:hypothetical protein